MQQIAKQELKSMFHDVRQSIPVRFIWAFACVCGVMSIPSFILVPGLLERLVQVLPSILTVFGATFAMMFVGLFVVWRLRIKHARRTLSGH